MNKTIREWLNTLLIIAVVFILVSQPRGSTPPPTQPVYDPNVQRASFSLQQEGERQACLITLKDNGGYWIDCDPAIVEPTATDVPSLTPTAGHTHPTDTPPAPTPTQTSLPPSPTRVPPSGAVVPFRAAPLCPDTNGDGHPDVTDNPEYGTRPDNELWHDVWNEKDGCHYDHPHNDDPALGNAVFGDIGESVSYPWRTANENDVHGHPGYKYYVNLSPQAPCEQDGYDHIPNKNCVTAFRIQYHDAGGNAHLVKRFHSYYMEVQIRRGNVVGYIKTGGWADFGCLHSEYKVSFLPLPDFDPVGSDGQTRCRPGGQSIHSDPYRAPNKSFADVMSGNFTDNAITWTSHNAYGYNRLGYFFFRTLDSWGGLDPNDPYAEHLICPDFTCRFNNSEHHVFNVYMMIPASLDTNGDGIVNYTGYTNLRGDIVTNCTAPSASCVPLEIVNAPVGIAIWSRNTSGIRPAGECIRDHDVYFTSNGSYVPNPTCGRPANAQPSRWIVFKSH